MKYLKIFLILLFLSYQSFAIFIRRLPFVDDYVTVAIRTSFIIGKPGGDCPAFIGLDTVRNSDTLNLNVYYDVSGQWQMVGCNRIDTLSLGVLAPSIKMIHLKRWEVKTPDTIAQAIDTIDYHKTSLLLIWPVGIDAIGSNEHRIFPNPVKDILKLHCEDEMVMAQIRDIQGRQMKHIKRNENNINVHDLLPGIYYLYIETKKRRYIERFIKE